MCDLLSLLSSHKNTEQQIATRFTRLRLRRIFQSRFVQFETADAHQRRRWHAWTSELQSRKQNIYGDFLVFTSLCSISSGTALDFPKTDGAATSLISQSNTDFVSFFAQKRRSLTKMTWMLATKRNFLMLCQVSVTVFRLKSLLSLCQAGGVCESFVPPRGCTFCDLSASHGTRVRSPDGLSQPRRIAASAIAARSPVAAMIRCLRTSNTTKCSVALDVTSTVFAEPEKNVKKNHFQLWSHFLYNDSTPTHTQMPEKVVFFSSLHVFA